MKPNSSSDKGIRWGGSIGRWLWLPVLAAAWEAVRILGRIDPLFMPSLASIAAAFFRGLFGGEMAGRWALSVGMVLAGLGIGTSMALLAVLAGRFSRRLGDLFSLISSLMHPLPGLALLPLVILWFGTGASAVLAIMVHAVLWPVYVNTESGLRSLPEAWSLYSRNLGMGRIKAFFLLELPGSFPHLISGIRTGWARSWRSFIAAEMVFGAVTAGGGLGWELFESRVMMDTEALYAALLAVMLTGMLAEGFLLNRWENAVRRRWGEA